MFSLHDIDGRIRCFIQAADDLDSKAAHPSTEPDLAPYLRGNAIGLREAARSLERMVEDEMEQQARKAMR